MAQYAILFPCLSLVCEREIDLSRGNREATGGGDDGGDHQSGANFWPPPPSADEQTGAEPKFDLADPSNSGVQARTIPKVDTEGPITR